MVLFGFVILEPLVFTNAFGIGSPYFCKLICPVGTLEGGVPQVRLRENKDIGECIRCGACKAVCPKDAISAEFCGKKYQHKSIKEKKGD